MDRCVCYYDVALQFICEVYVGTFVLSAEKSRPAAA